MMLLKKRFPWFGMGMVFIFLLSLTLHFWGLSRFNSLVFDEVYYVKYAHNYLTHTPLFDAHPPLGKYMIAIGIWIGSHFPFGQHPVNNAVGVALSPFTYRWLNALTGSLLPLVVGGIAYQLTRRYNYALIAALFTTCDGLFLVESRYALINIYLVFFGLLGQLFFLMALAAQTNRGRWVLLAIAGIFLGASTAVKWNGLAFLLGIYLIWIYAWLKRWVQGDVQTDSSHLSVTQNHKSPLENLTKIKLWQIGLNLLVIPAIVYCLIWIPHLQINTDTTFLKVHEQMLGFHEGMKNGPKVHPYCSNWYTWPLMLRPVVYFYENVTNNSKVNAALPPLPAGMPKVIYDVHAMGNPALWWLSSLAMLLLIAELIKRLWIWIGSFSDEKKNIVYFPQQKELWCAVYLVLNYAANFLPWIKVTRCTFLYLYMGGVIFTFLGLAWLVERWLHSIRPRLQRMGLGTILVILLAFVFWLPIYLGLPLSPNGFQIRMWLQSWI